MKRQEMSERLIVLENRKLIVEKVKDCASFKTLEEAQAYIQLHKEEFEELKYLDKEIRALKWELMTEEERQKEIEVRRQLAEKFKDDKPINDSQ